MVASQRHDILDHGCVRGSGGTDNRLWWQSQEVKPPAVGGLAIQDQTETNLINLRRTIYLTIMSSMDFEEAGHKLMKIELGPGQEMEIVTMVIECCSQEKTYLRYRPSASSTLYWHLALTPHPRICSLAA